MEQKYSELQRATSETTRRRTGGRSARVRESVLKAAQESLAEGGVAALSFSEIGRRAGVHATSVQRRWGTVENVLFDALLTFSQGNVRQPDTGSLRDDLVHFSRAIRDVMDAPLGRTILFMIASATDQESEFEDRRSEYVRNRFNAALVIFQRAADRGELNPGTDLVQALEMALGPLYFRSLITRKPIDDKYIDHIVDTLLNGVLANGTRGGVAKRATC